MMLQKYPSICRWKRVTILLSLQIICCFQDNGIVAAYKISQEVMAGQKSDARNLTQRANNFYELVVTKFNDETWVSKIVALPDLQVFTMTCVALKKGIGVTSDKKPRSIASMKAAKKVRTEREDTASMDTAFTVMRTDIQNLDKIFKGMAKSMDKREKERDLNMPRKEQIQLSNELYVTMSDVPEQYKNVLRDRLHYLATKID